MRIICVGTNSLLQFVEFLNTLLFAPHFVHNLRWTHFRYKLQTMQYSLFTFASRQAFVSTKTFYSNSLHIWTPRYTHIKHLKCSELRCFPPQHVISLRGCESAISTVWTGLVSHYTTCRHFFCRPLYLGGRRPLKLSFTMLVCVPPHYP